MPRSLYIGLIVVGICYDVQISISVPTASKIFGMKYYGMIYKFLILMPIGSFLFSKLLVGILYDIKVSESQKINARPIATYWSPWRWLVFVFWVLDWILFSASG